MLALRAEVPALAVDPVAGGAKATAQAGALGRPAVLPAERAGDRRALDEALAWCLSPRGRAAARRSRQQAALDGLPARLRDALAAGDFGG